MAWYRSPWTACIQFIYEAKEDEAAAEHNKARLDRVDCLVLYAWVCITWARGHVVKEGHSRGWGCLNWMCAFSPPFLLLRCELHGYLSARKRQGSHSYLSPFHHTGPKETHGTRWTLRWTSAACV